MYATCETPDCGSAYTPVPLPPDYGTVICGPCGTPVTNITDIKPTEGTVLPQWILDQLAMQNSDN